MTFTLGLWFAVFTIVIVTRLVGPIELPQVRQATPSTTTSPFNSGQFASPASLQAQPRSVVTLQDYTAVVFGLLPPETGVATPTNPSQQFDQNLAELATPSTQASETARPSPEAPASSLELSTRNSNTLETNASLSRTTTQDIPTTTATPTALSIVPESIGVIAPDAVAMHAATTPTVSPPATTTSTARQQGDTSTDIELAFNLTEPEQLSLVDIGPSVITSNPVSLINVTDDLADNFVAASQVARASDTATPETTPETGLEALDLMITSSTERPAHSSDVIADGGTHVIGDAVGNAVGDVVVNAIGDAVGDAVDDVVSDAVEPTPNNDVITQPTVPRQLEDHATALEDSPENNSTQAQMTPSISSSELAAPTIRPTETASVPVTQAATQPETPAITRPETTFDTTPETTLDTTPETHAQATANSLSQSPPDTPVRLSPPPLLPADLLPNAAINPATSTYPTSVAVDAGPVPASRSSDPSTVTVTLQSDPSGAQVITEAGILGTTPLTLELTQGRALNYTLAIPETALRGNFRRFSSVLEATEDTTVSVWLDRIDAPPKPVTGFGTTRFVGTPAASPEAVEQLRETLQSMLARSRAEYQNALEEVQLGALEAEIDALENELARLDALAGEDHWQSAD